MSDTKKTGPIYGVQLIDSLPIPDSEWTQAMPSRCDLEGVQGDLEGQRVVAGYEVLLSHWRRLQAIIDQYPKTADGIPIVPPDNLFVVKDGHLHEAGCLSISWDCHEVWITVRDIDGAEWVAMPEDCFFAREAAEAAKEKN